MNAIDFEDYDDGEYPDDDPDDWDDPDCGLTDNGFCYDIGTEHCSFFCPYSHLIVPNAEPTPEVAEALLADEAELTKIVKGKIPF